MLPRDILRQVRRIHLHTRRLVDDVLAGAYHSTFKGRGMEFDEVREYTPGDEVRTIDWNVTARRGQTYVKRYVETQRPLSTRPDDDLLRRPGPARRASVVHL